MGLNMRVQGEILFILAFACKVFETAGNTTLHSEATTLDISTSGINADYSSPAITLGSTAPQSQTSDPNTYNTGSSTSTMKVYTSVQSTGLDISTSGINADYSSPAVTLGSTAPQSQTPEPNTYNTGSSTSTMKVYTSVQSTGLDISTSGINADYSSPAVTLGSTAPQSQTPDPNTYNTGSSTSTMKVYTSVQSTGLDISTSGINADYSSPAITLGSTAPQSQTPDPNTYNTGSSTSTIKVYTSVQSTALGTSTSTMKVYPSSQATTLAIINPVLRLNGSSEVRLGYSGLSFFCDVPQREANETVHFKLYRNETNTVGEHISRGNEEATFVHLVRNTSEGMYTCKATFQSTNKTGLSQGIFLTVLVPVEDVTVVSDPPSAKVWEGERLTLTCNAAKGNRLRYEWHFKTKTATMKLVTSGRSMTIHRVLGNQAGNYSCVANNNLTAGHSQDIEVEVKVPVSVPRIWYSVHKQVKNYSARITCEAERGSPPVTFTLLRNTRKIMNNAIDLLNITFVLPITLDQNMGIFTCQAENGKKPVHSVTQTVYVARVRGVSLESRPHPMEVSVNEEMVFNCSVEEGTFPVYKWMFNGHHLQANPDSYSLNQQGNILTIPSATLVHDGTYVCSVCDAFDKTHCIKSAALQAEVKEPVPVSIEDIAIAFGCFLLLVIVLSVCCVVAFKYRTGEYNPNSGVGMEKSAIWDKDMDEQFRDYSMDNSDLESVTKM